MLSSHLINKVSGTSDVRILQMINREILFQTDENSIFYLKYLKYSHRVQEGQFVISKILRILHQLILRVILRYISSYQSFSKYLHWKKGFIIWGYIKCSLIFVKFLLIWLCSWCSNLSFSCCVLLFFQKYLSPFRFFNFFYIYSFLIQVIVYRSTDPGYCFGKT